MKIYSFQHKEVLKEIINNGVYKCEYVSEFRNQAPNLYKLLQEALYSKTGIDSFPIFGWSSIEGVNENSSINDVIMNTYYKIALDYENYVLLELEIPDKYVLEHDFFSFSGFKLDEEEELETEYDVKKFIYDATPTDYNIQASFPIIYSKWLKNAYSYKFKYADDIKFKLSEIIVNKINTNIGEC